MSTTNILISPFLYIVLVNRYWFMSWYFQRVYEGQKLTHNIMVLVNFVHRYKFIGKC